MPTNKQTAAALLQTPIGLLEITATAQGICAVGFIDEAAPSDGSATQRLQHLPEQPITAVDCALVQWPEAASASICTHLTAAVVQLQQYFLGQRQQFSLTLAATGTAFQQQVWQLLGCIGFAKTCSYGDIAKQLNNPKAVRAVGGANGRNPIAIIVPCHRVMGANGQLTGYAGGLSRKIWLMQFEQQRAKNSN